MPPALTITVMAVVAATALWSMRAGWRGRGERTAAVVPVMPDVPDAGDPALGDPVTGPADAIYVSTTVAGDWLERVVAHDLGARAAAVVQVFTGGIRIERQGSTPLWIPARALRAAATAPGMAGKYVGGQGLVVLTWEPPGTGAGDDGATGTATALDTGLRARRAEDRAALLTAAQGLVSGATTTTPTEETP